MNSNRCENSFYLFIFSMYALEKHLFDDKKNENHTLFHIFATVSLHAFFSFPPLRYYNSKLRLAAMGLQRSGALEKVRNYIILKDELLTLPETGDRSM